MNRDFSVERLFPLGDFKNIKFRSEFNSIPQSLALDTQFMNKLAKLMMYEVDVYYREYLKILRDYNTLSLEESLEALDKVRVDTLGEISAYLEELED